MSVVEPEPFLSMREALMEVRGDVKNINSKLDRIDREGSIGTKQELEDHEARLRVIEDKSSRWSGGWTAVGILVSAIAGITGLGIGLVTMFASG